MHSAAKLSSSLCGGLELAERLLALTGLQDCAHSPVKSYQIWFSSVIIGSGLGQEYHRSCHIGEMPTPLIYQVPLLGRKTAIQSGHRRCNPPEQEYHRSYRRRRHLLL